MPAPTKACIICGEKASLRCSRCRRGPFCSAPCQRRDWPAHRALCVQESRKPEVEARAVRKPSPMADVAAALGPVEACIKRKGAAAPEDIQRSDRCVLTLTPMVFGRCGERECGGEGDDYDRLLASPRSLRSEADAFAKACGRFALLELLLGGGTLFLFWPDSFSFGRSPGAWACSSYLRSAWSVDEPGSLAR